MESFSLPALEPANVLIASPALDAEERERERQAVLEQARQQGYADGLAAGRADGGAELQPALATLRAAAAEVEAERDHVSALVEDAAVELAIKIAEQILVGQLAVRPEALVDVVRGALRRLIERDRVTVLVNPEDLDLMRASAPELVAELGGIEHLDVQAERRVARGGAVVRTLEGEVDASVKTKLERVREVLAGVDAGEGTDA